MLLVLFLNSKFLSVFPGASLFSFLHPNFNFISGIFPIVSHLYFKLFISILHLFCYIKILFINFLILCNVLSLCQVLFYREKSFINFCREVFVYHFHLFCEKIYHLLIFLVSFLFFLQSILILIEPIFITGRLCICEFVYLLKCVHYPK